MEWSEAFEKVERSVLKIETSDGQGTGFLCRLSEKVFAIATAYHVVEAFDRWGGSIEFIKSGRVFKRSRENCKILSVPEVDAALIKPILAGEDDSFFDSPEELLVPSSASLTVGTSIGWIGFPGALIEEESPSAFVGRVALVPGEGEYIINGTVVKGVSGSPVIIADAERPESPRVLGIITYHLGPQYAGDPIIGLGGVVELNTFLSDLPKDELLNYL